MEETQTKAALGGRPRKQVNALKAFSLSVKPDIKPKGLWELRKDPTNVELKQLQHFVSIIL